MAAPLCCAFCHFAWEEREVFCFLPPKVRQELLREHAAIKRCGYAPKLVKSHGARELLYVKMFCPPEVAALVIADHEQLDMHQVHSASCCCPG